MFKTLKSPIAIAFVTGSRLGKVDMFTACVNRLPHEALRRLPGCLGEEADYSGQWWER